MIRTMNWFPKLVLSAPLGGLAAFCLFGFLTTFEPLPPIEQWTWRLGYGGGAALCVSAIICLWRRKRPTAREENATTQIP